LAVAWWRPGDTESAAPILGVLDGAYAVATVVDPCRHPRAGPRRIEIRTRVRADARLYHAAMPQPRAKGRRPLGGPRLAAPHHHLYWSTAWQKRRAWVYGRGRRFPDQQLQCRWSVSGAQTPVHVLVVGVDGDEQPWFLVPSALDWSAAQVVEAFTARFRQEDGFRDPKQRLGMEECRAWTKEPVLRPFQVQRLALTLLRLLPCHLDQTWGAESWWSTPEWSAQQRHASIRDLCRLFWRHRAVLSPLLIDLEEMNKTPPALASQGTSASRAAGNPRNHWLDAPGKTYTRPRYRLAAMQPGTREQREHSGYGLGALCSSSTRRQRWGTPRQAAMYVSSNGT
jgi:hypothetical protein